MLKLRGKGSKKSKVGWESSVIDNELLNKKKSKSQSEILRHSATSLSQFPLSLLHLPQTETVRRILERRELRLRLGRLQRLPEGQALLQAPRKGSEGAPATNKGKRLRQ